MLIINAPSCDALRTCCLICKACGGPLIFHCILIQSVCLYVVWWFSLIAREFQLDLWLFPPVGTPSSDQGTAAPAVQDWAQMDNTL